jgi:diadenosine tetraphosphate (Ap4A) HIT family hydrolase
LENNIVYGCVFCEPREELIIEKSEHFIVLHDPFPLMPGHIMITSKEHFGCAGEIPENWFLELTSLKSKFSKKIKSDFRHISLYEHGRAGVCHAQDIDEADPNSCNHFHLHILPLEQNIQQELKKIRRPF